MKPLMTIAEAIDAGHLPRPSSKPPALAVKPKRAAKRGSRRPMSGRDPIADDAPLGDALVGHLHGLKLASEANAHTHWRERHRRSTIQRPWAMRVTQTMLAAFAATDAMPTHWQITITRVASHRLDSDNIWQAAKHVRDGIADALELDDGDPCLRWIVRQEKGAPKTYAVRIELRPVVAKAVA